VKLVPGRPLPVDIDETLVLYKDISRDKKGKIAFEYGDKTLYLTPHQMNIAFIKHCKNVRGYTLIAWSANGGHWAKTVIEGLGLTEYFDFYMQKPIEYVDDKPVEQWMTNRVWINES
jgi:hypothetical protein